MISSHNARRHLLAASLGLALVLPAAAEDAHHPPGAAPPPAATAPTAPAPAARGMGMMGQGMMGQGMMGHGMMGQGSGMSMMSMMGMGEAGRLERVNGHLAFLEAELKIGEAQRTLWSAFAQAVRASADKHNAMASMASGPDATPVDRLAHQEHTLAQRLDGVRAIRAALTPLYAALSEAQKKTFAELLPMRMMM
jgi:hypothetical protein